VSWFTDSSALVKRYVKEPGSKWVRREITHHQVLIAQITPVEIVAALRKRFRQGDISEFACYQARKRFLTHLAKRQFRIVEVSSDIINKSLRVAFDRDLRAYDAVQLATALNAAKADDKARFVFITADTNLERAGVAEGIKTDNPLNH
jgi:uncharacterized protein